MLHKHLSILGFRVKDRVTGVEGVVTSVSFDLFGCIQALINRGMNDEDKPRDQYWYDIARLETTSESPVMEAPDFQRGQVAEGRQGPAEKPAAVKP